MVSKHLFLLVLAAALCLSVACTNSRTTANTANADNPKDNVANALKQAGYDDVNVDWDADKKVITLKGRTRSDDLKSRASEVAQQAAPGVVVSNELSIEPVGAESAAKKIEGNVDGAIEKDFKAALISNQLDHAGVRYHAKNGVLTLEGKVKNTDQRTEVEKLADSVPNVQQVVNKINVDKGGTLSARPE